MLNTCTTSLIFAWKISLFVMIYPLCIDNHVDNISWIYMNNLYNSIHIYSLLLTMLIVYLRYPRNVANISKKMIKYLDQDRYDFLSRRVYRSKIMVRGQYKTVPVYKHCVNFAKRTRQYKFWYIKFHAWKSGRGVEGTSSKNM